MPVSYSSFMSVAQPIFILGSPCSFTSLVWAMLGQHPETYGVPELNLLLTETLEEFALSLRGSRQFQSHGLLRTIAQLYAGEQTLCSIDMARRWISNRLHCMTAEIYFELCHKVSPLRLVESSHVYATDLEILNRIYNTFPHAYFLHLLCHPKTQGESIMKIANGAMAILEDWIDYSTEPPVVEPQYGWYKLNSNILDFLKGVPASQKMTIRGEDIINEPCCNLENICRWLNLNWDESVSAALLRPQDSSYASYGPYGTHLGLDPHFLKYPALEAHKTTGAVKLEGRLSWRNDDKGFIPEVLQMAQEFGYE